MQSKRKKFWIIFGTICTCVIAVVIVFSLVFRLKTVDVEIRSREEQTFLPEHVQDKVLVSGEFQMGKNMFFYNTDSSVEKIEKNIPFVKVEQVIKNFPNVLRVYISERTMKFRVHDETNQNIYYILDEDFKVLKIIYLSSFDNGEFEESIYYKKTIEVDKNFYSTSGREEGDFIVGWEAEYAQDILNATAEGIYGRTKDIGKALSISSSINEKNEFQVVVNMKYKNIKIISIGNNNIANKIWRAVSLIYDDKMIENAELQENETIIVETDINGEIVVRRPNQQA